MKMAGRCWLCGSGAQTESMGLMYTFERHQYMFPKALRSLERRRRRLPPDPPTPDFILSERRTWIGALRTGRRIESGKGNNKNYLNGRMETRRREGFQK